MVVTVEPVELATVKVSAVDRVGSKMMLDPALILKIEPTVNDVAFKLDADDNVVVVVA